MAGRGRSGGQVTAEEEAAAAGGGGAAPIGGHEFLPLVAAQLTHKKLAQSLENLLYIRICWCSPRGWTIKISCPSEVNEGKKENKNKLQVRCSLSVVFYERSGEAGFY